MTEKSLTIFKGSRFGGITMWRLKHGISRSWILFRYCFSRQTIRLPASNGIS